MKRLLREDEAGRGAGRMRMCALTRERRPETELIRFVAAPDGSVVPDLKAKLPGRGIWIGLDREAVAEAARKNVFARGLKTPARPAPDLPGQVAARLREAALGRLGLARKAGAVVTGFAKVEAALGRGSLEALIVAADAAEDGRRKMLQALRRGGARHRQLPILRLFPEAELSLAMGRPNVIHAAVLQSPAGRSFADAALRLQRYEGVRDGVAIDNAAEPQDMANE